MPVYIEECDIFGCRRDKTIAVDPSILDGLVTLGICEHHSEFLLTTDSDLYDIGFTFRHEVEIRMHPITPVPPA